MAVAALRPALLAVAAAALLAVAPVPRAAAKAPSTTQVPSLEWVRRRLAEDRSTDSKPAEINPNVKICTDFEGGNVPLESWGDVVRIVENKENKPGLRTQAATALVNRFRKEKEGNPDQRKVRNQRKLCGKGLLGMVRDDSKDSRAFAKAILEGLFPGKNIDFNPADASSTKRNQAYAQWDRAIDKD